MSLNEVMTCVRENIPAIAVVFNNGQWGAEKKNQIDYFEKRYLGTNLKNPNFADVAEAMGANGITVEHVDEIGDALRGAVKSSQPDGDQHDAHAGARGPVPARCVQAAEAAAAEIPEVLARKNSASSANSGAAGSRETTEGNRGFPR